MNEVNIAADALITSCNILSSYCPEESATIKHCLTVSLKEVAREQLNKFKVLTGIND